MQIQIIRKTFITLIIFTWVSSILETTSSRSIPSDKTPSSIYDALTSHGLPMGILPKGVKNYTLDEEGRFEVFLEQACNAKFESELHYDRNVSGKLSFGQIGNLTGISAQELFLWFPVKGIRVDVPSSGLIYFDVGVVFKQFSVSLFESPPDCLAATLPPDLVTGKSIVNNLLQVNEGLRFEFDEIESGRESI